MKTIIIFVLFIISISFVTEAQTSLKITNGVLKVNENTAIQVSSDLIMESGAYIKNDGFIEIKDHFKNDGNESTIDYSSPLISGKFKFSGSSEQIIHGSTETIFEDIAFNNTNNVGITLNTGIYINGKANFEDGIVNSSSINLANFLSGSSLSLVSDSSHVNGPVTKKGSTDFLFPIGKSGIYRTAGVFSISSNETFTAEYFDINYTDVSVSGPGISHVGVALQYWTINRLGTETASILLSWDANSSIGMGYHLDLIVARYDGIDWISNGGNNHTGDYTGGTVESNTALPLFGDFTLGSATENNPLPVNLINFSTECDENTGVDIKWSTASEINNDFFTIEKSFDGYSWNQHSEISGVGNSNELTHYEFYDNQSASKNTFYRLIQTDYDGVSEELMVSSIACKSSEPVISIYPNPTTEHINLKFTTDDGNIDKPVSFKVYNVVGQLCFSKLMISAVDQNTHRIELPSDLKNGTYIVHVGINEKVLYTEKIKIIK